MSVRLKPLDAPITIEVDGEAVPAREGEPVAASLIAAKQVLFSRSPKYHRPRGAFCFSGACSHCLMRVDGVPNVPTCRVPARPGMRLERQNVFPDARLDFFAANDLVFRKWFNHHEFLTGVPFAQEVLLKVARQLAGLGQLPDVAPTPRQPAITEALGVVIVGAGAAGTSAAAELSVRGVPYVLFERDARVGGRLVHGPEGYPGPIAALPPEQVRLGALVVGLFADDGRRFLAVVQGDRLHLVFFEHVLLANGGQPSLLTFEDNDLPGIYAARAVSRMIRLHDLLPGKQIAIVGEAGEARALAGLVMRAGGEPVAVGAQPVRAHGSRRVEALTVRDGETQSRFACDAVALCGAVSPASELAREGGAEVTWDSAHRVFTVKADELGRTGRPGLWVAGELRGPMSIVEASLQGARAGQAIAGERR